MSLTRILIMSNFMYNTRKVLCVCQVSTNRLIVLKVNLKFKSRNRNNEK